jgi:hypothetical protein
MKKEKYSGIYVNSFGALCCNDYDAGDVEIGLDCLFEVDGHIHFGRSKPFTEEQTIWPEGDEV